MRARVLVTTVAAVVAASCAPRPVAISPESARATAVRGARVPDEGIRLRPTWRGKRDRGRPVTRRAHRDAPSRQPPHPRPRPRGPIDWYAIATCESRGPDGKPRWHLDGAHDGGLQFLPDTWRRAGGTRYAPYAWQATPAEQIATAQAWVAVVGCYWCSAGWPHCGRFG